MSRMRNFQRQLVVEGLKLEAYPINKILDVDHKEDIAKAEAFIHPLEGKTLVGVCRGNEFSPNCVDNDAAIMNAVKEQLEALGAQVMLMCEKEFCRKAAVLERAYGWPRCRVAVGVDGFFSMARSKQALDVLGRIEEEGVLVVNSSLGVNRCIRRIMTERFIAGGIAMCRTSRRLRRC